MFALVDCNNFYASCERVFRPDLEGKPIAVLSNNDGCIIARSQEVKDLGIKMGTPYFKERENLKRSGVVIFSSNYELYGDMSHRVVETLRQFSRELEVYSIDEVFLGLQGFEQYDLLEYGQKICHTVKQWTGIPVGVGIAPTKTLAKVANKQAKLCKGVCIINDAGYARSILSQFPIEDLWGVGRQYVKMLNGHGVFSAAELIDMPDKWIRDKMTIQGLRMVYELRGIACIPLEEMPEPQKALAVTRSFGKRITSWQEMNEAIVHYTTSAGEKLRKKGLAARYMQVFLHTSKFSSDPYYANARGITLPWHSNYTPEMIHYSTRLLRSIYRQGFRYAKAGIILSDLVSADERQYDLLEQKRDTTKQHALMQAVDSINNKMGKHTVGFAGSGIHKSWHMQRNMVSPCYTTRWAELPSI